MFESEKPSLWYFATRVPQSFHDEADWSLTGVEATALQAMQFNNPKIPEGWCGPRLDKLSSLSMQYGRPFSGAWLIRLSPNYLDKVGAFLKVQFYTA